MFIKSPYEGCLCPEIVLISFQTFSHLIFFPSCEVWVSLRSKTQAWLNRVVVPFTSSLGDYSRLF